MSKYFLIILLLAFFVKADINAQQQGFLVKTASFSSRINDEFSPVFYKVGIVFCSNERDNSLISYKDDQNRLFKIFYITKRGNTGWSYPKLLTKELSTGFNDGPATFNEKGNIIYYSRNNSITGYLRNISDTTNKLGIFSAELINGIWTNIKPFPYNDPLYTLCTPALNPDGERIYFSSDIPGGKGGMDLYYCDFKNNSWDKPVNLGPVINTSKNESFPFACKSGKLFFSSDGHPGFGGKDLYYTMEINGDWMLPVHLDSTINSTADDFGLVTDSTFDNGYFSTNRKKTDDIFSFTSAPVEFTNCDSIKENTYCFTFFDELHKLIDTIPVIYKWDFGEGIIRTGTEVKHCFPGPGDYSVKLTITDELTGDTIADQVKYKVNLENIEQAGFNSKNIGIVDQVISFNGLESNLKGFQIADFLWNFGDGFKSGKPLINKKFGKEGEYIVELGLLSVADSLGKVSKACAIKKIKIFNNYSELKLNGENNGNDNDSAAKKGNSILSRIYFMDDLTERFKLKIKESLKNSVEPVIRFDKYGIVPASYNFLDKIVVLLKENPGLRLELELYSYTEKVPMDKIGLSEELAQELAFYFKNKGLDRNVFRCNGFGLYEPALGESSSGDKSFDGMAEFKFMKN